MGIVRVSQPPPPVKSISQVNQLMMLVPIFFLIMQGIFLTSGQFLPNIHDLGMAQTNPAENMNVNMNGVKMNIMGGAGMDDERRKGNRGRPRTGAEMDHVVEMAMSSDSQRGMSRPREEMAMSSDDWYGHSLMNNLEE